MPSESSLESLYVINKSAKRYREKNTSKASERASALYELKYNAIRKWKNEANKVEKHFIDNKPYACFYFDYDKSFHVPVDVLDGFTFRSKRVLEDFSPQKIPADTRRTEEQSLRQLYNDENLNVNSYVSKQHVMWTHLPVSQSAHI